MPVTLTLLQFFNLALAGLSIWTGFRDPFLWKGQALLLSTCVGALLASLTLVLLGTSLLLSQETKWRSMLPNLVLGLCFMALQGWLLFLTGQGIGLYALLRAKLGL